MLTLFSMRSRNSKMKHQLLVDLVTQQSKVPQYGLTQLFLFVFQKTFLLCRRLGRFKMATIRLRS